MRVLATISLVLLLAPRALYAVGHERIPLDSWAYRAVERFAPLLIQAIYGSAPRMRAFVTETIVRRSVSMLTEGWDASTVTHVLGVRAFGR